jgi:diacylglycerol kinase (ATP)
VIAAIVNPRAGSGAAGRRWPAAERLLAARVGPVTTFFTEGPGHATELARELARAELLVVAGGDGTLNEVVNGGAARIAVMPLASGGDFSRTIGVRSVRAAVEAIASKRWRRVDVWRAGFSGGERLFLNAAGFGMAGTVAREAPRWRAFGAQRYLAAAVPSLAAGRSYAVSVRVDDGPAMRFDITTAAVCNGQYQGGGIRIAPEALPGDGLADVTVVERVSGDGACGLRGMRLWSWTASRWGRCRWRSRRRGRSRWRGESTRAASDLTRRHRGAELGRREGNSSS